MREKSDEYNCVVLPIAIIVTLLLAKSIEIIIIETTTTRWSSYTNLRPGDKVRAMS